MLMLQPFLTIMPQMEVEREDEIEASHGGPCYFCISRILGLTVSDQPAHILQGIVCTPLNLTSGCNDH